MWLNEKTSEGDELCPRKWNHDFCGIPILRREEQHRPTIIEAEPTAEVSSRSLGLRKENARVEAKAG